MKTFVLFIKLIRLTRLKKSFFYTSLTRQYTYFCINYKLSQLPDYYMDKFEVIQPSALLAPYVRQYWFLRMENVVQGMQRFVPNGCIMLTFHKNKYLQNNQLSASCLSGQATTYTNLIYSGTVDFISIVFQPAGAMAFFSMPMSELNKQNINIELLHDPLILELEQRLAETDQNKTCVELIEQFLLRHMVRLEEYKIKRVIASLEAIHSGENDILQLAQTACLGYKQFKRLFTECIGTTPKEYIRINRFQKASYMLQTRLQAGLTPLAETCGYYDKSHLIKEMKEFSGYTPKEYLSVCSPYSDYHVLFRSAFLDIKP